VKNLSEEQLDVLEKSSATASEIDSIAALGDQEKIDKAVKRKVTALGRRRSDRL